MCTKVLTKANWGTRGFVMKKLLVIMCTVVLAMGVAGCAGIGKAPPVVTTKG
jgi:hypothetical protein